MRLLTEIWLCCFYFWHLFGILHFLVEHYPLSSVQLCSVRALQLCVILPSSHTSLMSGPLAGTGQHITPFHFDIHLGLCPLCFAYMCDINHQGVVMQKTNFMVTCYHWFNSNLEFQLWILKEDWLLLIQSLFLGGHLGPSLCVTAWPCQMSPHLQPPCPHTHNDALHLHTINHLSAWCSVILQCVCVPLLSQLFSTMAVWKTLLLLLLLKAHYYEYWLAILK